MQINNSDLGLDPIFVSQDNTRWAKFRDLGAEKLNSCIYFSPSSSPRISRQDSRQGSCFSEWIVPTASLQFQVEQNTILTGTELTQELCLEEYQSQVVQHVVATLQKCYETHSEDYMAYSGSIDSGVVLSFIIKMGLAHRTHVRCFLNKVTDHPDALRYNQERIDRINGFFQAFGNSFASTGWEEINHSDVVNLINQGKNYLHLIGYTLSSVFERYANTAWIGGFHGNRTLIHQRMFLDQMRIVGSYQKTEIKNLIERYWNHVYSPSIKKLNLDNDPVHVKFHTHCLKPWHALSGQRNNKIYMPLASDGLFFLLRSLNPAELTFEFIADAIFGKELVTSNAPELNFWIDKQQSSHEQDNLENINLPTDNIDFSKLEVPMSLNHDTAGLEWIVDKLNCAKAEGTIEINSLVSIKNLQWIKLKTQV